MRRQTRGENPSHAVDRTDPIARFMLEHDDVLRHLSRLHRACSVLERRPDDVTARGHVDETVAFLGEEIGEHNRREEEALFSVLDRYVEGPTRLMRAEHRALRKQFAQLRRSCRQFVAMSIPRSNATELSRTARVLTQMMVNHIHKENQILFPLVRKFLTKDALREIAARISTQSEGKASLRTPRKKLKTHV